ncbi:MAG: hypothetical protein JNJ54_17070 [Myxococcaceae bacterium]|nr:hypothetical protein [Myxococcaceae bacterium]
MNLKALSLGIAIGFALAVVPSCGTPAGNCGPNNCTGCCNAGACVTPDKLTDAACGSSGNACSNCTAMSQVCNMGTKSCFGGSTGGGSAAGGSAGGGSTAGGSTAGGSTGGGSTGGGSTAGGSAGGSVVRQPCDLITNPTCPTGAECVLNDINGSAGTCIPGACSLLAQDCAGNTKCMIIPVGDGGVERVCTPFTLGDAGTADNGQCQLSVPDSCQRGAQCVGFQGGGTPTCRRFCGPLNMCSPGSDCDFGVRFAAVQNGTSELHLVCSPATPCNPFDQTPCAATDACQLGTSGTPVCRPAGMVMNGGTCTNMAFCARGLQCVAAAAGGMSGVCRAFCNVDGGMPSCAAGMCQNNMGTGLGTCSM